jgi:PAS domain S-box-containing protein
MFMRWFQKFFKKDEKELIKLREEIRFLKTAFWHLPHIAFIRDREGKFVLVNQKFASNFKANTIEEILGKSDSDFNPNKEQVAKIQSQDREIMDEKKSFRVPQNKYLDKSGKATYLETIKNSVIIDGFSNHVLGFSIDITEKVELENRAEEAMVKLYSTVNEVLLKLREILEKASEINRNTKIQSDNLEFLTQTSYQILESNANSIQMISNIWNLVNQANKNAELGNEHLHLMLSSMESIQENSERMLGIIELIDGISDQTNLLSLNASIESARAGKEGLGFAVVAREISKLADESAENTKGISKLVKQNNSNILKGNENVNRGGQTFKTIISEVESIESLISNLNDMMKVQTDQYNSFNIKIEEINSSANEIEEKTNFQKLNLEDIRKLIEKLNTEFTQLLSKH